MSKNKNNFQPVRSSLILYGRHPVFAAIANPERGITKILCTQDNAPELKTWCTKHKRDSLSFNIVDRKDIDKVLPRDAVHQGYAIYCQELDDCTIEDICIMADNQEDCRILVLDQVTDPQNIGAIIRSCVAFNTTALVLQDRNSPQETGTMAKASAGMIEHLPICRVTNLSRALQQFKEAGFWILGMDGYAQTTIEQINKKGRTAIVMGSEGKGLRRLVEETCDGTVKLPISDKVESLNVSTAAAITLYELSRK